MGYFYFHFPDEDSETQRDEIIPPGAGIPTQVCLPEASVLFVSWCILCILSSHDFKYLIFVFQSRMQTLNHGPPLFSSMTSIHAQSPAGCSVFSLNPTKPQWPVGNGFYMLTRRISQIVFNMSMAKGWKIKHWELRQQTVSGMRPAYLNGEGQP